LVTYFLWVFALALKALLIGGLLLNGLSRKYVCFFSYISLVTFLGILRLYVYIFQPSQYFALYWWTQFFIVAAGFWVTWEIFGRALQHYLGVSRLARLLVAGVFLLVLAQFALNSVAGPLAAPVMVLERNMRSVEVALLLSLVSLIMYYRFPISRNLFGLFLGYGLFLTSHMVALFLHNTLGPSAQSWLNPFRQICELLVIIVWLATLWNEHPVPLPTVQKLEEDYAVLSTRTSRLIANARAQITRILTS